MKYHDYLDAATEANKARRKAARLERQNKILREALSDLEGYVDISTTNLSKRCQARWVELRDNARIALGSK